MLFIYQESTHSHSVRVNSLEESSCCLDSSFFGYNGITVLDATPANMDCWDQQLAKVLFGYRCGIQTTTKFSPFMILTSRTPRLRADNYLQALTDETDNGIDMEAFAAQFLQKVELIASIHNNDLLNVEQAQKQQKKVCVTRRGKHLFEGLIAGQTMAKMKKPGK